MSKIFMGLTIATIVGVPIVTLVGQNLSWRYCLAGASILSLIALVFVYKIVPNIDNRKPSNLLNEFSVLKDKLVLVLVPFLIST